MPVTFQSVKVGKLYTRAELASLWGYSSFHALARGLVTPAGTNFIIMFITEGAGAQTTSQKYTNKLVAGQLHVEGPDDHFAEQRVVQSTNSNDTVHLFYRALHKAPFEYFGPIKLIGHKLHATKPSEFTFKV